MWCQLLKRLVDVGYAITLRILLQEALFLVEVVLLLNRVILIGCLLLIVIYQVVRVL